VGHIARIGIVRNSCKIFSRWTYRENTTWV